MPMTPTLDALLGMLSTDKPAMDITSSREFYRPCLSELEGSSLFECFMRDDEAYGSTFLTYLVFPRDERSIRLDRISYRGTGLLLYLCTSYPVAVYGAMGVYAGSHSTGSGWLAPEEIESLPSPDWSDVEMELLGVMQRHGIKVLTREEACLQLRSLGLQPPAESNMGNPDTLFYAFFNNDY
ncbi:hypothetical protein DES53_108152 [Roseimicrobium gellanilyticum]|uniref:Uncharacterized protein n=2 Tax=Roseimicrobium gellanilyticum TaxID=748857 RepID=A0A366HF36_9BACT|nr:hypothetical protein DES53_108152 [Roseimicrobium gellanilyticum]